MSDMAAQKPATAARMYDYFLGGVHNFPADQDAARKLIALFPHIPAGARANRAYLRRAVRHLADHDHKSPERMTEEELRDYFLSLKNVKHSSRAASPIALCGITFFYELDCCVLPFLTLL